MNGVAIGRCSRRRFGANHGTASWPVVEYDGLAQQLFELGRHDAGPQVNAAARRDRDDDLDRPVGKTLGRCPVGEGQADKGAAQR